MSIVQTGELNSDSGRIAVLNEGTGSKIIASNQCGDFAFKLFKSTDPRVDIDSIADYDKNVIAYVGARNWNKFKYPKDYTNASQLKFSNIKTPGPGYLVDMKWWIDYSVKITLKDFPYPNKGPATNVKANEVFNEGNIMCLRPFPLHQCTDNIHLRLNNRDLISYPIQTLNQRMEYWRQDKLKESCGFCPHRKPNVQTTYELNTSYNTGRSPFMNIGATYDGDYGNETTICEPGTLSTKYTLTTKTYADFGAVKPESSHDGNTKSSAPCSVVNGEITFTMREPVMVEPLDYYSSRGGSKTMNNVCSIDLEYNFNNLRNMLLFNHNKMLELSQVNKPLEDLNNGIKKDNCDWWSGLLEANLESYLTVEIVDAKLELNIATPHVPPSMPFVTDYVEFRRFEKVADTPVAPATYWNDRKSVLELESDIYSLSYMPNSIYLWVAPNAAWTHGSNNRVFYNNTYAQITHMEIDYGNLQKLGQHYNEKDLYLMALRNGLEDRQYIDWTRTPKVFYKQNVEYKAAEAGKGTTSWIKTFGENEFFGVGSVLRIIPGVDLCSGGEVTLIGGMKITNETIRFRVQYRPLNMFDDKITYSLFVAFEYNGICTITPNFCDLAMIHIDSFNQIANATRAPSYKISRIYGKGLWDKVKKVASAANNFARRSKIVSRALGNINHPVAKAIGTVASKMGYGYPTTRMQGGQVIPPGSFYRTY